MLAEGIVPDAELQRTADKDYFTRAIGARAVGRHLPADGAGVSAGQQQNAPAGAWYRIPLEDGAEFSLRHDHPAARTPAQRQRLAERLGRAVRESAGESGS